jgi:Mg2+/Co2+ transporter CorB
MGPSEPSGVYFFVLFVLLLLSGFFSGAEVALISLSRAKSRSLVQQEKRGASAISFLKEHPEHLLIIILIGNNIVNVLISVLSTVIFTNIFGDATIGLLTGILTILLLVFEEIMPKTLAQKHAEKFALFSGPVIFWMGKILFPLV